MRLEDPEIISRRHMLLLPPVDTSPSIISPEQNLQIKVQAGGFNYRIGKPAILGALGALIGLILGVRSSYRGDDAPKGPTSRRRAIAWGFRNGVSGGVAGLSIGSISGEGLAALTGSGGYIIDPDR